MKKIDVVVCDRAGLWSRLGGAMPHLIFAVLCCWSRTSPAAAFDPATFCSAEAPKAEALLKIYNEECPAWLAAQFVAAGTAQSALVAASETSQTAKDLENVSKQLAQLQALYPQASVAAALKEGTTSFSAATHYAVRKQALLIYDAASSLGKELQQPVSSGAPGSVLLLVGAAADEQLIPPVESALVIDDLAFFSASVAGVVCAAPAKPGGSTPRPALSGVQVESLGGIVDAATVAYSSQALLGALATVIKSLQPSLDQGAATPTLEPAELIRVGILSGLGTNAKTVRVTLPPIDARNPVLEQLRMLREAVARKQASLAGCDASDPAGKKLESLTQQIREYLVSIRATDGKTGLLEAAVRRAALVQKGVDKVLVVSTPTNGGSVATFHPSFWRAPRFLAMADIVLTYRMVDLAGVPQVAGIHSGTSRQTMSAAKFGTADKEESR